jgi:hypothetical protein
MSDIDFELDRLRQAFASLGGQAPGAGVEPGRLWSAAHESFPPAVRPGFRTSSTCGACAEAWQPCRDLETRTAQTPAVIATCQAACRVGWGPWPRDDGASRPRSPCASHRPQYRAAEEAVGPLCEERRFAAGGLVLR